MPAAVDSSNKTKDSKDQKHSTPNEKFPCKEANGRKIYNIKNNKFDIPGNYTVTEKLGQGSYGMVVAAHDGTSVKKAIKKCSSLFKYPEDGKRILREIKLMQMLDHRNILGIKDVLAPTDTTFEDIYIVTECLDSDLAFIIRSQTLTESHCKYLIYQILRALKYIHSAHVIHRDLKPANILVNFDCRCKICDFGLARGSDPNSKPNLTNYVVTRWYRAPELLLDNNNYTSAIDIWAAGCIFAEMLRGEALFPGESPVDQMRLVSDGVGIPEDDDFWWVTSQKSKEFIKSKCGKENRTPGKSLKSLLPAKTNPLAFDFLRHMLAFNPYKRWSADWLLDHPYLTDVHRPDSCTRSNNVFRWRWDSECPDDAKLRKLFWRECLVFHPECEQMPGLAPPGLIPASPTSFPLSSIKSKNKQEEEERV